MRYAVLAIALIVAPLDAQTPVRSTSLLLSGPNGRELATVRSGATVRAAGAARQGHTPVTLDGYIDASLLGPGRDSFPNVVKAPSGARLRSAGRPDAPILADLRDGMGVTIVSRSGQWARVRRTGWVGTASLGGAATSASGEGRGGTTPPATGRGGAVASPPPSPRTSGQAAASAPDTAARPPAQPAAIPAPPPGALTSLPGAVLRTAPEGGLVAELDSGAVLTPLARMDGWTRVRVEGWVHDDRVIPADTALQLALSGADVRAAPERYRGAVVRWNVEFISVQKADLLRRDLRPGEPYMLARGPGSESGLLYVAIPPALMAEVERFKPLDVITITARIRVGRSEPAGVPVLDLIAAARK